VIFDEISIKPGSN